MEKRKLAKTCIDYMYVVLKDDVSFLFFDGMDEV